MVVDKQSRSLTLGKHVLHHLRTRQHVEVKTTYEVGLVEQRLDQFLIFLITDHILISLHPSQKVRCRVGNHHRDLTPLVARTS